nr:MAG TPA: hypothetical protein [Caudoviricetes sp.]
MSSAVCGLPFRFFPAACGSVRFLTGQTTFSRFCFRSDKHAAVLRLQSTQPKDRRVYTALTGILTEPQAAGKNRKGNPADSAAHSELLSAHEPFGRLV